MSIVKVNEARKVGVAGEWMVSAIRGIRALSVCTKEVGPSVGVA